MFERNEFSDAARERKVLKEWDLNEYTHLTVSQVMWFDPDMVAGNLNSYFLSYVRFDPEYILTQDQMPDDFHDEVFGKVSREITLYISDEDGSVFGWDYMELIPNLGGRRQRTKREVIAELESNARIIEDIRKFYMGR